MFRSTIFKGTILVVVAFALSAVSAQSKISGSVKDSEGNPIRGVVLRLEPVEVGPAALETTTKKKGNYFFAMVRRGQYRLSVKSDAMRVAAIDLKVRDDDGRIKAEQSGAVRPGDPLPPLDLGDTDTVAWDFELVETTAGAGEFGTGLPIMGSGEIVKLIENNQHAKARAEIERILETDANNAPALYLLAYLEIQQGNTEAAASAIDRTLAADPAFVGAKILKGLTLEKLGKIDEALATYREEAETSPDTRVREDAWVRVAMLAKQAGKTDESVAALRKIIELNPANAVAHSQLIEHYAATGQDDELLATLATAPADLQNDPLVHFNPGASMYNHGKIEQAAEAFAKTISLAPDLAEAHKFLGFCRVSSGEIPGAVAELEKYLELAPQATDAADVRNLLDGLQKGNK